VLTEAEAGGTAAGPDDIRRRVADLLAAHDPAATPPPDFLRARFDAGLAWVHYPPGLGGLGAPRSLQAIADAELAAAGAPDNNPRRIGIGLGMAAPTILAFGTPEQQHRRSGRRWRTRPGGPSWWRGPTRTCPSTPASAISRST
jgi:alkylation response protein AidB-like acyl-CoA dehydrogenase